jgi:hypothetical protein
MRHSAHTPMDSEPLGSSMEIQLEARNLPNLDFGSLSDPLAVLDMRIDKEWKEFGSCMVTLCLFDFKASYS